MAVIHADPTQRDKDYSPESPELSPISTPPMNLSTNEGCTNQQRNVLFGVGIPKNLMGHLFGRDILFGRRAKKDSLCSLSLPSNATPQAE